MNDIAEIKRITTAEIKKSVALTDYDAKVQMLSESLKTFSIILFRHYQQTFPRGKKKCQTMETVKNFQAFLSKDPRQHKKLNNHAIIYIRVSTKEQETTT